MSANPARWHADPSGRHELRYWDGRAWTAHVSDRGVASIDPVPAPAERTSGGQIMPSSEGRSTPATREPLSAGPTSEPPRTQHRQSQAPSRRSRPTPIVTRAGWSGRTKLLVWFVALDAVVATVVIWLIGR